MSVFRTNAVFHSEKKNIKYNTLLMRKIDENTIG